MIKDTFVKNECNISFEVFSGVLPDPNIATINSALEMTKTFKPDLFIGEIKPYANIIANVPLSTGATVSQLPKSISFLELYKVGKIEMSGLFNGRISDFSAMCNIKTDAGNIVANANISQNDTTY